MSDGIQVDVAGLRQGSQGLQAAAQQLRQEWSAFSGRVQSMGDIFGDDDVGGLIGVSYQAAHQIADSSFTSVINALGGFADGLSRSAENHERNEQDVASQFQRLMG